jgi:hypothetical protein
MLIELECVEHFLSYSEHENMIWTPKPNWVNPDQITKMTKVGTAKLISGFSASVYEITLTKEYTYTITPPDEIIKRIRKRNEC